MTKSILGITTNDAEQLLKQYGPNELNEKKKESLFSVFFSQFRNLLVILLILAALASLALGDVVDGIFILLIVILNALLGFVQEFKAEKAIEALKKMTVSSVRVIRDGVEQKMDSKLIVPGDILVLEEGDKIPADCELIESIHMEVNEASLTGESVPVEKNIRDREKRKIFLGTVVSKGRGKARVTATGMKTRFGGIAEKLSGMEDEETPLTKKLNVLGKQLGILALVASSLVFVIGILTHEPLVTILLTSISLAVAAVPEGLPAVVTITLAVGMQRMAKKRAILRKLSSIEALGATTVIATDKTGTLTKNEMRVSKIFLNNKSFIHSDTELLTKNSVFSLLLRSGIYCNTANLVLKHDRGQFDVLGDTTEGSLLLLANDFSVHIDDIRSEGRLIEEFAFDPVLKRMSVVWETGGKKVIYTKGAPERIIELCTKIEDTKGTRTLTAKDKKSIQNGISEYARQGLRVIALCYRPYIGRVPTRKIAETDLIFLGLVGISDPPRAEVKQAIELARQAGIKTVMITGDNEITAHAIGSKIGLIEASEMVLTGAQLESLTDDELLSRIDSIRIFARTSPSHKLRIVQLLKRKGHIVTVTGDGVNDALALKSANVGVSMGITGTDVAKEASDMILTDDNYSSLVHAVEQGRIIYANIKSAILYLVGCNVGEVVAVVVGILLGWPLILTPVQLLYINLVTDGLPAIALAVSPKHEGIMKKHPRNTSTLFQKRDFLWFIEVSSLTAIATLIAFAVGQRVGNLEVARTMAFTTIILVQQLILLDVWHREQSFFRSKILFDVVFIFAFLGPIFLQPLLLYIPIISGVFKVTSITFVQLGFVVVLSLMVFFTAEIRKYIYSKTSAS